MNIVILGPPGSGKGTYSDGVSKKFGIPHISTGDLVREAIKSGSELGKRIESYYNKGLLVPDEIIIQLLKDRLSKDDCKKGFILDGFPRNINQAKFLDEIVRVDLVIYIDVPDEIIINRLSTRRICKNCGAIYNLRTMPPKRPGICDRCGGELYQRDDDKPETIKERLKVYREHTAPLIEYYRERGILKEFKVEKEISPQEGIDSVIKIISHHFNIS